MRSGLAKKISQNIKNILKLALNTADIYVPIMERGDGMSSEEILYEIERLRTEMNSLVGSGVEYFTVLKVSQELDKMIVMYHYRERGIFQYSVK